MILHIRSIPFALILFFLWAVANASDSQSTASVDSKEGGEEDEEDEDMDSIKPELEGSTLQTPMGLGSYIQPPGQILDEEMDDHKQLSSPYTMSPSQRFVNMSPTKKSSNLIKPRPPRRSVSDHVLVTRSVSFNQYSFSCLGKTHEHDGEQKDNMTAAERRTDEIVRDFDYDKQSPSSMEQSHHTRKAKAVRSTKSSGWKKLVPQLSGKLGGHVSISPLNTRLRNDSSPPTINRPLTPLGISINLVMMQVPHQWSSTGNLEQLSRGVNGRQLTHMSAMTHPRFTNLQLNPSLYRTDSGSVGTPVGIELDGHTSPCFGTVINALAALSFASHHQIASELFIALQMPNSFEALQLVTSMLSDQPVLTDSIQLNSLYSFLMDQLELTRSHADPHAILIQLMEKMPESTAKLFNMTAMKGGVQDTVAMLTLELDSVMNEFNQAFMGISAHHIITNAVGLMPGKRPCSVTSSISDQDDACQIASQVIDEIVDTISSDPHVDNGGFPAYALTAQSPKIITIYVKPETTDNLLSTDMQSKSDSPLSFGSVAVDEITIDQSFYLRNNGIVYVLRSVIVKCDDRYITVAQGKMPGNEVVDLSLIGNGWTPHLLFYERVDHEDTSKSDALKSLLNSFIGNRPRLGASEAVYYHEDSPVSWLPLRNQLHNAATGGLAYASGLFDSQQSLLSMQSDSSISYGGGRRTSPRNRQLSDAPMHVDTSFSMRNSGFNLKVRTTPFSDPSVPFNSPQSPYGSQAYLAQYEAYGGFMTSSTDSMEQEVEGGRKQSQDTKSLANSVMLDLGRLWNASKELRSVIPDQEYERLVTALHQLSTGEKPTSTDQDRVLQEEMTDTVSIAPNQGTSGRRGRWSLNSSNSGTQQASANRRSTANIIDDLFGLFK